MELRRRPSASSAGPGTWTGAAPTVRSAPGTGTVRRAVLVVATVVAVLLAACGGDDGGDRGDGAGGDTGADHAETSSTSDSGEAAGPSAPPRPTGAIDPADLLAAAGDAPAARGAGLDQAPGDPDRAPLEGFGETAVAITAPDGTVTGWCLLLALTQEQRNRGLMEVTDLGGYSGMLFVWSEDSTSSFYMRNTPTPLSIGWFDAEGELVSTADMEPCGDVDDCLLYPARGPYRFALEVPQGELASLGVQEGSRLAVGGQCA
jgi:uncharacterized membrane protein (UPF0127 family)